LIFRLQLRVSGLFNWLALLIQSLNDMAVLIPVLGLPCLPRLLIIHVLFGIINSPRHVNDGESQPEERHTNEHGDGAININVGVSRV